MIYVCYVANNWVEIIDGTYSFGNGTMLMLCAYHNNFSIFVFWSEIVDFQQQFCKLVTIAIIYVLPTKVHVDLQHYTKYKLLSPDYCLIDETIKLKPKSA